MIFPVDMDLLRNNPNIFKESFIKRRLDPKPVDDALELDNKRKELQKEIDRLKHKKNIFSRAYGLVLRYNKGEISKEELINQLINLGFDIHEGTIIEDFLEKLKREIEEIDRLIDEKEKEYSEVEEKLINILWKFPNIISPEVPVGDESKNTPIRFYGIPKVYDIESFEDQTVRFGWKIVELKEILENKEYEKYIKDKELLKELYEILLEEREFKEIKYYDVLIFDLLNKDKIVIYVKVNKELKHQYNLFKEFFLADTDKAGEISGSRFYFEFNDLSIFDLALSLEGLYFLIKRGYKTIIPPYMLKREILNGIITLDDFEDMMYKIENEDLYLIGTAEHPITALFYNEIIDEDNLPLKIAGWSPCFRREAGAHGKDTKGLFRLHQFHKVEQYIFSKPEDSEKYHQELINNQEEFLRELNIPYRVIIIASQDMGKRNYKQYDIEGWFPGQQKYRELGSGSNVTDWQSRRSNIRYRKKNNELAFLHTLNCTLVAVQRTISCIIENYYREKEDRIYIPNLLKKYFNKDYIEKRPFL